jgi:hypothetical protein
MCERSGLGPARLKLVLVDLSASRALLLERMPSLSHRYPTGSQIDGAAAGVAILVRTAGSAPLTGFLAEASL